MAGHGGAAPTLNPEDTCTCTRLEVRQRTDSVGVVPSKTQTQGHVRVPVRIGTFERGIEVFYLPTSLAGVKVFRTGLFSLFALHRESSLFLLFSV
ncbi:unnamed protein product [Lasius platythorax]|uniref:Uncharacterized protein n=1 Tax=Lasius platythorax TaxID=488582 RepID=A0AAV2N2K8_9HYME